MKIYSFTLMKIDSLWYIHENHSKRLEKVIESLLRNFLAELLLFWVGGWVGVGKINNIDHLSPVETEIGTELGNKYWFRKIVIRLPHS